MSQFWQILGAPSSVRNSFCNIALRRTLVNLAQPHIYKKIWQEDELAQYVRNNIVYENDDLFISSLPVGIGVGKTATWCDAEESFASDVTLNSLGKKLRLDFGLKGCYITVCPRRNASGLTVFSKTKDIERNLKGNFTLSASKGSFVFCYLAVVFGQPSQTLVKDFIVKRVKMEAGYATDIRDVSLPDKKGKRISYKHEVICSTEHVSLVKAEASSNTQDCVRHILAGKCFTPVFGDSWNCQRRQCFMFGVPLVRDLSIKSTEGYALEPKLLEKLQLQRGEEKFIPPHIHLYSLKLQLKHGKELFASVPPPEHFIWTCKQLGLHGIEKFSSQRGEESDRSSAQN